MGIAVMEDHVLAGRTWVDDAQCVRGGACADVCPRDVLRLGFRTPRGDHGGAARRPTAPHAESTASLGKPRHGPSISVGAVRAASRRPARLRSMSRRLTETDGRRALRDHVVEKAATARRRHGPVIDAAAVMRILDDREVVRYPTGLRFDDAPLEPAEFAFAQPLGARPSDGFCLFVHPAFERRPEALPLLVAYHLVDINDGEIAAAAEAELFGATLLGTAIDEYYHALCALADGLSARPAPEEG
jgi:ferredoxin